MTCSLKELPIITPSNIINFKKFNSQFQGFTLQIFVLKDPRVILMHGCEVAQMLGFENVHKTIKNKL